MWSYNAQTTGLRGFRVPSGSPATGKWPNAAVGAPRPREGPQQPFSRCDEAGNSRYGEVPMDIAILRVRDPGATRAHAGSTFEYCRGEQNVHLRPAAHLEMDSQCESVSYSASACGHA